jgi:hypothetical protein
VGLPPRHPGALDLRKSSRNPMNNRYLDVSCRVDEQRLFSLDTYRKS